MKVKAIETGFFDGSIVQPGQEFEVPSGTKGKWFVPVGDYKEPAKPKPKAQPQTLSELAKAPVTDGAALA